MAVTTKPRRIRRTTYKGTCFICGKENTNIVKDHKICIECHDPKKCHRCKKIKHTSPKKKPVQPYYNQGTVIGGGKKKVRHIQL